MTPADFAALPWTPIIGVSGIVGTFLSGFLANRVLDTIRIIATKAVTTTARDVVTAVMAYHTTEMLKVVGELQQSPEVASASKDGMLTAIASFREAVRVELGVEAVL